MKIPYLQSETSLKVDAYFMQQFKYSTLIGLQWLSSDVVLYHDIYPLGYESAHLLLWSREDALSVAAASNFQRQIIGATTDSLLNNLHVLYPTKNIIFFEHGPGFLDGAVVSCGGCHTDQAHIHFIVLGVEITFPILLKQLEDLLVSGGWENPERDRQRNNNLAKINTITQKYPYLLVGWSPTVGSTVEYVYAQRDESSVIESQLMRKVVGIISGHPEPGWWHWKDFMEGLGSTDRINQLRQEIPIFRQKFI